MTLFEEIKDFIIEYVKNNEGEATPHGFLEQEQSKGNIKSVSRFFKELCDKNIITRKAKRKKAPNYHKVECSIKYYVYYLTKKYKKEQGIT
jgi:hypothetical protein